MFFRLFLAFTVVLGFAGYVSAQDDGSVGLDDLPECAQPCAKNAAAAVSCATTDIACLCSHSDFTSSTQSCASQPGVCGVEDRSSVSGVLGEICSPENTSTSPTSSSAPSTTLTTSAGSTTTSGKPSGITITASTTTSTAPITPTSQSESETARPANTTPAATTAVAGPAANTATAVASLTTPPAGGSSSTTVVVQTVVLPQTSDLTSGVLRAEGGAGVSAFLPVLLAMVGGLLL